MMSNSVETSHDNKWTNNRLKNKLLFITVQRVHLRLKVCTLLKSEKSSTFAVNVDVHCKHKKIIKIDVYASVHFTFIYNLIITALLNRTYYKIYYKYFVQTFFSLREK